MVKKGNDQCKMMIRTLVKFVLPGIIPITLWAQPNKGYVITGRIEGLKEGEKVIMKLANGKQYPGSDYEDYLLIQDSGRVKEGSFHIEGYVPEGPREYMVTFDKHTKVFFLLINNGEKITIKSNSNIENLEHGNISRFLTIEGSPTNYSGSCLAGVTIFYRGCIGQINRQIQKISDSIGFNGPLLEGFFLSRDQASNALYYNFLYETNDTHLEPYIRDANLFMSTSYACFSESRHASFWFNVYNQLDTARKNSFLGRWLKEQVALCVGQPIPEFTLPDSSGKMVSLKQIVGKGKFTIVHLWTSNSIDRKKYQDELRLFYNKYHDRGLNVIGLSSDIYANEWKEVLQSERFPWFNVCDPKGKYGIVDKEYHEYGSPQTPGTTNVLLDAQGKIVAWDVHGVELQWYLWKQFEK